MNRANEIENIIIGTLLDSDGMVNYYDECRSIVTPEMFYDDTNRRIYSLIVEMNSKGMRKTTPCDIFDYYREAVLDILPRMCELCTSYSFVHKKFMYNEWHYLYDLTYGTSHEDTAVTFADYVERFIQNAFRYAS